MSDFNYSEEERFRKYAEAHGCGELHLTKLTDEELKKWKVMTESEPAHIHIEPDSHVYPMPCIRDENGKIMEQTVKQLFAKIDEELNELKEAVFRSEEYDNDLNEFRNSIHEFEKKPIAEEAADTITAITTLCFALGINADIRDEAQRRVNNRNRERGRL